MGGTAEGQLQDLNIPITQAASLLATKGLLAEAERAKLMPNERKISNHWASLPPQRATCTPGPGKEHELFFNLEHNTLGQGSHSQEIQCTAGMLTRAFPPHTRSLLRTLRSRQHNGPCSTPSEGQLHVSVSEWKALNPSLRGGT